MFACKAANTQHFSIQYLNYTINPDHIIAEYALFIYTVYHEAWCEIPEAQCLFWVDEGVKGSIGLPARLQLSPT